MTSANELLRSIAGGDREAFRALYDRHAVAMHSVALRITRRAPLASDAVHDAFLHMWRKAATYPAHGDVEAWLSGLVRQAAENGLRRAVPVSTPKFGQLIVCAFVAPDRQDDRLGDFHECFHTIWLPRFGRRAATLLYVWNALCLAGGCVRVAWIGTAIDGLYHLVRGWR